MYHTAVIADDFTSVTDCTIPFASRGLSTAGLVNLPEGKLPACDVLGINTDSRTVPPELARSLNKAAAEKLVQSGYSLIYKSVDSTLRGNLGAEIDGVMDGGDFSFALVAPAFPHYGRITMDGIHYLNGQRLENSPIARDPACPAVTSEIKEILGTQSSRKIACLGLETVRASSQKFTKAVQELQRQGCELMVLDAVTEDDLEQIAKHAVFLKKCLVVGSTGLARHMAAQWYPQSLAGSAAFDKGTKPIIVAAASVSPVTAEQIDELIAEGNVERCVLSPQKIVCRDTGPYIKQAKAALLAGMDLIFQIDASPKAREETEKMVQARGISKSDAGTCIANTMAKMTVNLLSKGFGESVVLTGGDMAQAMLNVLKSPGMELYGEVEPGIPIGRLMGRKNCLAVTKAGAFGTPQALCSARRLLKQEV